MTLTHNHEPASVRELFAKGVPDLIAGLLWLGLLLLGLRDVLDAKWPYSDDWHFWWGLLHCALGGFLWIAAAMRFGWLVPTVVIGILLGEFFGFRRGISRLWFPASLDETLFPLQAGAAVGYFVGVVIDLIAVQVWNTHATQSRADSD
jgi:hypothetical protein